MPRPLSVAAAFFVTLVGVLVYACKGDQDACTTSDDCAAGAVCLDGACVTPADGGSPADAATVCSANGITCNVDSDCCSNRCNSSLVCANPPVKGSGTGTTSPSPTSSGTTTPSDCHDLYELCTSNECCPNLSCQNGVCR